MAVLINFFGEKPEIRLNNTQFGYYFRECTDAPESSPALRPVNFAVRRVVFLEFAALAP